MKRIIVSLFSSQTFYTNLNKNITKRYCILTTKQNTQSSAICLENTPEDIDWNKEFSSLKNETKDSVLSPCTEDLSYIAPYLRPTFNFAAYINKSDTLQKLVKLGVNLHKIEKKKSAPEYIMKLDFDRDIKKHLFFLNDLGISSDLLGDYLTVNPYIFKEDIETLTVRINYLQSKAFDKEMITRIVSKNPYWLMFSTQRIDRRLAHFQNTFNLTGNEIRSLVTKQPKLITYNMDHIKLNTFSIKEEMGFDNDQMKTLLLKVPKLWMMSQTSILQRFEYIHNTMNISHNQILQVPEIIKCRKTRVQQRHQFLLKLGRAQFDPRKAQFVSLEQLVQGTDAEFCANIAKSSVQTFNVFLKSL